MKKVYICPDFNSKSGIAKYGRVFFDEVLQKRGYKALHLQDITELTSLEKNAEIFVEIGLGTAIECEAFQWLISHGYQSVDVMVHDAPFIKYPIWKTNYSILSKISKIIQLLLHREPLFKSELQYARFVYVMNQRASHGLKRRYRLNNVKVIPHILNRPFYPDEKFFQQVPNLVYIGFIGANKGLDYALALHEKVLSLGVECSLEVVGKASCNKTRSYLERLKEKYTRNVTYLGFVDDQMFEEILKRDNIVILPTKEYHVITPTSGNVLNAMQYSNVLFTNAVNSVPEFIADGETGFFLSGNLEADAKKMISVIESVEVRKRIGFNAYNQVLKNHSPSSVIKSMYEG
ncbi:glycosyltransferase family 4 protein [Vibrio vulnificus]|nr:glycosyltransferase family 4 protein [Vibrio vulnificus]